MSTADAGWLDRFTATLGPQMDYYERPFVGHDDPIFVIRTRPGVIFDDDFWEVFHRFPFKICHVAYYGPARSQDDVLVKAAGATDSTGLTDTLARQASHVHTDQAGITDTAAAPLTAARTATDPAGLTDATSTELAKTITAVDTTGLTDQTSLHRSAGWADTTGLTDVTEGSAAYTRAVTDSTGLADSAAAQRLLLAEPIDSAGLTDTATTAATTGTAEQPVHIGLDTATTAGGQLDTTTTAAGGLDTTTTAAGLLD